MLQPSEISKTVELISSARLSSYNAYFKPKNDYEVYGVYIWNEEIAINFLKLISMVEVTLRNKLHNEFSKLTFDANSSIGSANSNNWYERLKINRKSKDKIKKITHKRIKKTYVPKVPTVKPDDVISKLTFGFWPHILRVNKDINDKYINYPLLIEGTFPAHPHANDKPYWKKPNNIDNLIARVDMVVKLRNRVTHFEPIWKLGVLKEERTEHFGYAPKTLKPAPKTPAQSIERLHLVHSRIYELLYWLSPERALDYRNSYFYDEFQFNCSLQGLGYFKGQKAIDDSSISQTKRELRSIIKSEKVVKVTNSSNGKSSIILPILY